MLPLRYIAPAMYDSFFTYIKNHSTTPITEAENKIIRDAFIPKRLKKRQYFLQEGHICQCAAFVVKGAMRQYSIDEKGQERILRLSIENWWAIDRESYSRKTPSTYNIDALEDSDLLQIANIDHLSRLNIPALNELCLRLDENLAIASQRRIFSIGLSAEERYAELVKYYPEFLQRFPQHIVASYLGIAKETLSRIRSNAVKNSPHR